MPLHFLIFAALRTTPFSALPYASKVIGRIDRKWDMREEIRASIAGRVPQLQQRARLSNRALARLLPRT